MEHKMAVKNYVKAGSKGVVKVCSKMGISTIQSYRGAQIFEAIGLHQSVIDKYFTWTPSRVEGVKLEVIEALLNHVSGTRSGIVGVYQRHAYEAEMREAVTSYETWLQKLLIQA